MRAPHIALSLMFDKHYSRRQQIITMLNPLMAIQNEPISRFFIKRRQIAE